MNKKVLVGLVVLIVVVLAWWMLASRQVSAPADSGAPEQISADLSGLDTLDLEADLQALDADLDQL